MFLLCALLFIQHTIAQTMDANYLVRFKSNIFDVKTQKTEEFNHGLVIKSAKIYDDALVVLEFHNPEDGIGMATDDDLDLKLKLENYINKKYNSGKAIAYNTSSLYSKYVIYLRPILNNKQKITNALFAIEETKNIKNNIYTIKDFMFTENELKNSIEFGHLKDGRSIYNVIKDNNDLKMLIYETPEKIYYVDIELTIEKDNAEASENNALETFQVIKAKTIIAPFYYDIKYQNSNGEKTFLDSVTQNEEFIVQAAKKDTVNPVTKNKITLIYNLKGLILPIKFSNNELTVKFILTAEDETLDNNGSKTSGAHSSYIKEITLKPDDVVEIKLSDNWPRMQTVFGYDPVTMKKYYYDYGIKKQSFFLKPVKK